MNRQKASKISNDVIGNVFKESLLEKLRKSPFSIAIDEGSDEHGYSYIGVSVKYLALINGNQQLIV